MELSNGAIKLIEGLKSLIRVKAHLADTIPIKEFTLQYKDNKFTIEYVVTNTIQEDMSVLDDIRQTSSVVGSALSKMRQKKPTDGLSFSIKQKFENTYEHFLIMKSILKALRKADFLKQDEIEMMASIGGEFYKNLSDEKKLSFYNMFLGVQKRKLGGEVNVNN